MSLLHRLRLATQDALTHSGPVGMVVSGGLDSSTVAVLARELIPALPTFTGWYDEPGFDERRYARLVAGRNHYEVEITPDDVVEHFDRIVELAPRPLQGPGMIGQYVVAMAVARTLGAGSVVLSGEGSDELFGGYARLMIAIGDPDVPRGYGNYQPPDDYPTDLEGCLAYDLERLPDLLAVDDAMCGAWDIEARAPFTDPRVVEFALALPPEQRVAKRYLREQVRGLVPNEIIDRKDKMGFPIPLARWAQGPLREWFMGRIGYVPTVDEQFSRRWWYELCESSC